MSEEKKQRTDDESVELGTVLQLTPHSPTSKVDTVERDKDTDYVSLDEVYTVTGQEAIALLGAECREYLNSKRLSPSAFSVLRISGMENLMPGYDRMNAVKGGESFLDTLKKGFFVVIKAVKRFVIAVIDWVVLRCRTLLGFEKTEKELAIISETSTTAKTLLVGIINDIAKGEKLNLDVAELIDMLPDNVTTGEMFNVISDKNKSLEDQIDTLSKLNQRLEQASKQIVSAAANARRSRGIYTNAAKKLREAFKNRDSFSAADILEFRTVIDNEIVTALDPSGIATELKKLVDEVYGVDLGTLGLDGQFKDNLNKQREILNATAPAIVTPEVAKRIISRKANLTQALNKASLANYSPEDMKVIKDLISLDDAELLGAIVQAFPEMGEITASYTAYSSAISSYVNAMEILVNVVGNIRRSIASVVNWSNKVDKVISGYLANDVQLMLQAQREYLSPDLAKKLETEDGNDSLLNFDYDKLFLARHPRFAQFTAAHRQIGADFARKHAQLIRNVNTHLAKIGARTI